MIELDNVSLGYNHQAILQNVSMKAGPGQILGLVGPNGSGKSTLIKGMTRVIDLFSGRISIDGRDIKTVKRDELARLVATVPQSPALPGAFTAFEVVLMGRTPHLGLLRYEGGKDLAIAWQAMEATHTQSFAERRVSEISGGERQRLVIARALTAAKGHASRRAHCQFGYKPPSRDSQPDQEPLPGAKFNRHYRFA